MLNEIRSLITDSDLHLLPLALQLTESIINARPSTVELAKSAILPSLFQLIQSPLLQGIALKSLLNLFSALGRASPSDYDIFVNSLVDPLLAAHTSGVSAGGVAAVANKKAASTVAQCIAVLAINTDQSNRNSTVKSFQNYINVSSFNLLIYFFKKKIVIITILIPLLISLILLPNIWIHLYRIPFQMIQFATSVFFHWVKLAIKCKLYIYIY